MSLVTIDGHIGAGGADLGRRVSKMLGHAYVDRLVLPGHVNPLQKSVDIEPPPRFSDRVWAVIEKAVRGIALGNAAGDPYYASAELLTYPLTWDSSPGAPMAAAVDDGEADPNYIYSLLEKGRTVLVQRAGAVALKGHEQVLKIGIFASWEDRIARVMSEQGLTRSSDAERIIFEREKAQTDYFGTFHSAHPEDESLYDLCINTSRDQMNLAAVKVARAAQPAVA